jgi:predicted phage-related endonuclease
MEVTMNNQNDFAPEVRNSAWWSGDSRKAANGKGNEAVLEKLGLKERPDLSQVEAVQMGNVMQPLIGRLAQDKLQIELKDADYALTHPKETWLKSHFDFISADGRTLVEAKNYNAAVRNKFDSEANIIPPADMAQIIHEAAVHNVEKIVLAVLFGGQNFETFEFTISEAQKESLIKDMARFWGAVATKQPLEPENTEQTKLIYSQDSGTSIVAIQPIEKAAEALKFVKEEIKRLEEKEENLLTAIQNHMQWSSELVSFDGKVLATWKNSKSSKRFDAKLFQAQQPDLYEKFVSETSGSRRFLLK